MKINVVHIIKLCKSGTIYISVVKVNGPNLLIDCC